MNDQRAGRVRAPGRLGRLVGLLLRRASSQTPRKVGPKNLALKVYRKRKAEIAERRFFPERIRSRSYVNVERNARYWKDALGSKTLRQITVGDIQPYVARRLEEEMAPASINRELTLLRAVFYMALGDGELDVIPFGKGAGKVKLLKENNCRVRYLTDKEEIALRKKIPAAESALDALEVVVDRSL